MSKNLQSRVILDIFLFLEEAHFVSLKTLFSSSLKSLQNEVKMRRLALITGLSQYNSITSG